MTLSGAGRFIYRRNTGRYSLRSQGTAAAPHRHGPVSEGLRGDGRGDMALRSSDELFLRGEGSDAASPSDLQRPARGPTPCTRCYLIRGAEVVKSFLIVR